MVERLGLSGQVVFTGFVTQQELAELYRGAAMMVYASFCGPENLPPLEAFALGCPVVAADVPGAFEQLGEAALLFDPLSPEDMADKIHALLAQPERRDDLRKKGFQRAAVWTAIGAIVLDPAVADDGQWGPISQAALNRMEHNDVLLRFIARRLEFWAKLKSFDEFGRGWTRRGAANLLFASEDN
jgi:hypothetical protein